MRKVQIAGLVVVLLSWAAVAKAADDAQLAQMPEMPKPQKEHEWLQKFVGKWSTETEASMEPGKPPDKWSGTETVRSLGGFWIVADGRGEMMGMPVSYVLTLGYDKDQQKYVGTWVDAMTNYLWKYKGTVDADGKTLTLETEGPCPMMPGKLAKFKEVTEFKSDDHRVFTSSMQGEDGKWNTIMIVNSRRLEGAEGGEAPQSANN